MITSTQKDLLQSVVSSQGEKCLQPYTSREEWPCSLTVQRKDCVMSLYLLL